MQTLMDEIAARNGKPGGHGCGIERFLSEQESWPVPEGKDRRFTRAEWESVLSNGRLQHKAVFEVMQAHDFDGGRSTVSRHRNGDCACRKS